MTILQSLQHLAFRRLAYPKVQEMLEREAALSSLPGMVHASADSPVRFDFIGHVSDGWAPPTVLRSMPHEAGSIAGILHSLKSLDENPSLPRTVIDEATLASLESYARGLGIASIGYADLDPRWIFRAKAVTHRHTIVLTMEMDRPRIELAPSPRTVVMVMETYNRLGRAANRLATHLRRLGYSAQAGHPLTGLSLYPPLARSAGLGWQGLHGLIITPEYGPRVRLATIYTSIENLPRARPNQHSWVEEFCASCRRCIRDCPAGAILDEPVRHASGQMTHVVTDRCFPYFSKFYGCSVCVKVCPFSRTPYWELKRRFQEGGGKMPAPVALPALGAGDGGEEDPDHDFSRK